MRSNHVHKSTWTPQTHGKKKLTGIISWSRKLNTSRFHDPPDQFPRFLGATNRVPSRRRQLSVLKRFSTQFFAFSTFFHPRHPSPVHSRQTLDASRYFFSRRLSIVYFF